MTARIPWEIPPDGPAHITQDHKIVLELTRDQFIALMGAIGAAQAVADGAEDLTEEEFTEAVDNPTLNELVASLKEPLTQALTGYGIDQIEQAGPDDLDGPQ